MSLRARLKQAAPGPVREAYEGVYGRVHRLLEDLPYVAEYFLAAYSPRSPARRLRLLQEVRRITHHVECPHEEREILAFLTAILRLPESVAGCVAEAGCYKGGSTAKISLITHATGRELVVFDSFEGIPENEEAHETDIFGHELAFPTGSYAGRLEEVEEAVTRYGHYEDCRLIPGWFEDTLPSFSKPIAAAYVDVDLASSTRTCVRYLYPLLSPGGVLISHDGHIPLVLEVLRDRDFWETEVGCRMPEIEGLGTRKLLRIVKPAPTAG